MMFQSKDQLNRPKLFVMTDDHYNDLHVSVNDATIRWFVEQAVRLLQVNDPVQCFGNLFFLNRNKVSSLVEALGHK